MKKVELSTRSRKERINARRVMRTHWPVPIVPAGTARRETLPVSIKMNRPDSIPTPQLNFITDIRREKNRSKYPLLVFVERFRAATIPRLLRLATP